MDKREFEDAHEVRRFLKENGITDKVKIRWQSSPFGPGGLFFVTLSDSPPPGSGVGSSGGSREPTRFFCMDDSGKPWIERLGRIQDALKNTNAAATTSI